MRFNPNLYNCGKGACRLFGYLHAALQSGSPAPAKLHGRTSRWWSAGQLSPRLWPAPQCA